MLVSHNQQLVRTAHGLQAQLTRTVDTIRGVVAGAAPIAGQNEERPTEYVVSAEDIEALRAMVVFADTWASVDTCGQARD